MRRLILATTVGLLGFVISAPLGLADEYNVQIDFSDDWVAARIAFGYTNSNTATNCVALVYSPYSDFEAMAQSDLDSLQVKLTYAGAQRGGWRRAKKSIVFVPSGQTVDMSLFDRLKRPRIRYSNDDYAVEVTASLSELKALIDSVGTLSGVTSVVCGKFIECPSYGRSQRRLSSLQSNGQSIGTLVNELTARDTSGTVDDPSYFSFSMVNTVNDTVKGYDTHIGTNDCRDLFAKLLNGLANNSAATKEILRLGCSSDCLPTNTPAEVTGDMLVSVDGYRLDHDKNQFVTTVTVKNNGASSVDAPLILTVQVKQGPVAFMNATGGTCRIIPRRSYIVLPVQNSLGPGASVEATLRFYNPTTHPIEFDSRVYSGDGIR